MDVIDKLEYKLSILEEIENKEARRILLRLHNHIKLLMGRTLFINTHDDSPSMFSSMLNNDHILEQLDDLAKYLGASGKRRYEEVEIHTHTDKLPYEICELCGNSLEQEDSADILVCSYCNYVKYINQTLTSTRSKTGNSDPKRHFIYWMTHIFGLEDESEVMCSNSTDIVSKIRTCLAYKNKSIEHLTIDDIRDALKETGMSNLYTNASFIACKITGRCPPRLSEEQYMDTQNLFLEAMRVREGLTRKINNNKIYYPYYIYKIFDIILKNDDRRCMNYIHLHKPDTMRTNDTEWKLICESIPRLKGKYVSTIAGKDRYI